MKRIAKWTLVALSILSLGFTRMVKKLRGEKTTKIQVVRGDLAHIGRPDETLGLDRAQRTEFKGISHFGVF
jgi:hypothetical protein